jgi:hypothetical protein
LSDKERFHSPALFALFTIVEIQPTPKASAEQQSLPSLSMSLPSCIEQAQGPAALFLNIQNILEPFGYTH